MSSVKRKDKLIDEAVDILDEHMRRSRFDTAVAWNTLSSIYLDFINEELSKCMTDPRYYMENYHVVKTEHEGFKTLYPFWDSQEIIYSEIMEMRNAGRPAKVLIDKARQMGSSTLSQGIIFQRTIFNEAINTLIVAQDVDQADYLFSMSVRAYESLPWWMCPEERFKSKGRYLVFDSQNPERKGLGSEIFVAAANKVTGVSVGKSIRTAHLSELSSWENAETLTEHIFPTMNAPDTIAILESTARGRTGFWYKFWQECEDNWGDESWQWKPIFVEWFRCKKYSIPISDKSNFKLEDEEKKIRERIVKDSGFFIPDEMFNWRRNKVRETVGIKGDDTSVSQEYPYTAEESFQSSGLCAFPRKKLESIIKTQCVAPRWFGEIVYTHGAQQEIKFTSELCGPLLTEVWNENGHILGKDGKKIPVPAAKKYGTRLRVWEKPEPGESYYLAADPAHGLEGRGDFSCVEVIRIGRGMSPDVQVAEWHGWINPTPFAHIIVGMAKWYNMCEVALEINSVGEKTNIEIFRVLEYPNLFRWKHYDKIKMAFTNFMGWMTTHKTRDIIITNMRERVTENTILLYSADLLDEMMDFSAEEEGRRFEGQDTNDDRVLAAMICLWCAHDSDYGKQAAAQPHHEGYGVMKHLVVDEKERIVHSCDSREEAKTHLEWIDEHGNIRRRANWSIVTRPAKHNFHNTEFSPVHDRQGPRQRLHYAFGIPAENISLDSVIEPEVVQSEDEWMRY